MGISSNILAIAGTTVDVVPLEEVGEVVVTGLVIKETNILNELSPYFESFFLLVC